MITVNLNKAKEISHEIRRIKRAEEFTPLDLKATIPSEAQTAEAARQAVREKYAEMQTKIDTANTPEELKNILGM